MKTGTPLPDLLKRIQTEAESARDFVVDTRNCKFVTDKDGSMISVRVAVEGTESEQTFNVTPYAHGQIAEAHQIPKAYYDRCKVEPSILDANVNGWFGSKPLDRMLRTVDGRLRAYLSDRYRRLDNWDLAKIVIPIIQEMKGDVHSCELTETRFYLNAVLPGDFEFDTPKKVGDIARRLITISNSEVGAGAVNVEPGIFILSCLNGATAPDYSLKKHHIGRIHQQDSDGAAAREIFMDDTMQADDEAFWRKVRDVTKATCQEVSTFEKMLSAMRQAMGYEITKPKTTVELTAKAYKIGEEESEDMLKFLIEGCDLSCFGLAQSITRMAQDVDNFDRSRELERIGGQLFHLNEREWNQLVKA